MQSLARRQAIFTVGMLACGCVQLLAAWGLVGVKGVEGVAYSVGLCLIPGWLTVCSIDLLRHRNLGAYVVLVGTGLRMVFVLLGLLVIGQLREDLGFREFKVWLIINYLIALALETWVVLQPPVTEVTKTAELSSDQ